MVKGTVVSYSAAKGFGFIQPDAGGRDVFIHKSQVAKVRPWGDLEPGEKVSFRIANRPDGRQAAEDLQFGDT